MNAREQVEQLLEDIGLDDKIADVDEVLNILQQSGTEEAVNFITLNVQGSEMAAEQTDDMPVSCDWVFNNSSRPKCIFL